MKIKIGITGQNGFIGKHLYNTIGLFPEQYERIDFARDSFDDKEMLDQFVSNCDVIVHLAALNRHNDPQVIYDLNISLVEKLVASLKSTNSKPHVIFSSSSQEEKDNLYGKSKRHGREILANWANISGGSMSGLIVPNVYGPFGHPNYNSFIATFSHQLTHQEQPIIQTDCIVKLIYVADLVKVILSKITNAINDNNITVQHTDERKVSDILRLLTLYRDTYFEAGIIPELNNSFELNLFNTFRSYIDQSKRYPVKFKQNLDQRGKFVELIRLNVGGQVSFSTTLPDITRGNHFHTRKIERFAVIKGKALIQLRKIGTDEVLNFKLTGTDASYVDMPVWYTHNIKNIGDDELYTVFWINEFYNPDDHDTFIEIV